MGAEVERDRYWTCSKSSRGIDTDACGGNCLIDVTRLSTSTSLMVEDRAWHLRERNCSCTGIVATCS